MNAKTEIRLPVRPAATAKLLLGILACFLTTPIFAQQSRRDFPPGAFIQPNTNLPVFFKAPVEAETTLPEQTGQDAPIEIVELPIVETQIAETHAATPEPAPGWTLPAYAPPGFAAYVPAQDTNSAIGIYYPSGSSDFVRLFAGKPRAGDPRLPPSPDHERVIAQLNDPGVTYEIPDTGSRAVLIRRSDATLIQEFPPGARLRGGPSASATFAPAATSASLSIRSAVLQPEPERTETGEILIRNFPPGSSLRRTP